MLEAAKLTVLNPPRCLTYLEHLPDTSITRYLECLTESVSNPLQPVSPPPDYEMHFLAARVHAHRCHKDRAISTAQTGLQITPKSRPIVRLKLQALLSNLSSGLAAPAPPYVQEFLTCWRADPLQLLPRPEYITTEDVAAAQLLELLNLLWPASTS
ncbi:MAG: hypothetical protein GX195_03690 [Firmicutes bacterium]|nr:hypothetical protein [Bacillota bacterium]